MKISKTLNDKINEQIASEFAASHLYLGMACALDAMGLKVLSKLFMNQSAEEREHALKFVHYLQEVEGAVKLGGIPEQVTSYKSLADLAQAALNAELKVTGQINTMVSLANEEHDHATHNFLMYFVDEQVEEESKMRELVQLVELAGPHVLQVEARLQHLVAAN